MKSNLIRAVLIFLFIFCFPFYKTFATEYFVSSISGNDSNTGMSSDLPWKSISLLESKKLNPGDIVNFERSSVWEKAAWENIFLIDDSGTEASPIIFRAYGEGDLPMFTNGGQVWNKGIKITANYIILEELHVINTGYCGFEIAKNTHSNIIRKCEVSNCGMGILCYGSNNLITENYIHNLKMIVDNEIPDTQSGGGDFGCVSFWIYGPDNEISYNKCIDNIGHSYDYITDGGFIEFYEICDGTYAHHNWVENGNGIAEGSNGTGKNITISYNVFIENGGFFALHTNNFTVENFKFENNTVLTKKGTLWNNMFNFYPDDIISERIFVRNNIFVLGGKASERISKNNNFIHTNNIYHLQDGAQPGTFTLGTGEKLADPKFVDIDKKDFRLQPGSPAINVGTDLGYNSDFNNKTVPSGKSPDLGAYEFEIQTGSSHSKSSGLDKITVAAYYFPNYHTGDPRNDLNMGENWSEWELVGNAKPKFPGHLQPKVPLWGTVDEKDPEVMAMKIDAAVEHGIDCFIFDWYMYEDGPFLNRCIDEGFLKAKNTGSIKFALMWANHDWVNIHPYTRGAAQKLLYPGKVSPERFEEIGEFLINEYFSKPNYWKINGKAYFSIYDIQKFVEGFGSLEATKAAMDRMEEKAKNAGLNGIHWNLVAWGNPILPVENSPKNIPELIRILGFSSATSYVWIHHTNLPETQTDYNWVRDKYFEHWEKAKSDYGVPYFPNVTVGWDPTPRCDSNSEWANVGYPFMNTIGNNTPENFKTALQMTKDKLLSDQTGPRIMNINCWNEWTEGSYLEPDTATGMKYLEAVKSVFK